MRCSLKMWHFTKINSGTTREKKNGIYGQWRVQINFFIQEDFSSPLTKLSRYYRISLYLMNIHTLYLKFNWSGAQREQVNTLPGYTVTLPFSDVIAISATVIVRIRYDKTSVAFVRGRFAHTRQLMLPEACLPTVNK